MKKNVQKPHAEGRKNAIKQLWVNPRSNIKSDSRWGERNITPSSGERFLELADIALGVKKPHHPKKKATSAGIGAAHTVRKSQPYSA